MLTILREMTRTRLTRAEVRLVLCFMLFEAMLTWGCVCLL
jgi:hypothetical protein